MIFFILCAICLYNLQKIKFFFIDKIYYKNFKYLKFFTRVESLILARLEGLKTA